MIDLDAWAASPVDEIKLHLDAVGRRWVVAKRFGNSETRVEWSD